MASFFCEECGYRHKGLPMAFSVDFRTAQYDAGSARFERDGELVEAGDDRFILANVELPVPGENEKFVWTCWISLSHASYERMQSLWETPGREDQEAAFGWLYPPPTYEPSSQPLKAYVHTRPIGLRPWAELEPTEHPLAVEQREGISYGRITAIYHWFAAQETLKDFKN